MVNATQNSSTIDTITVERLLSFGNEAVTVKLQPLNVLIGANGSGKSNLMEILRLLHAAPRDIAKAISEGGGVAEWIWKGGSASGEAIIDVTLNRRGWPIRHAI